MALYEIQGLGFTYPQRGKAALSSLDVTIDQGEFVVLCGASGCGKTTLLRLLKGTVAPTGTQVGNILFSGTPLSQGEERQLAREIGYVMQNPENQAVCEYVWQELAFGLESLGYSTGEIRIRVAEMASFFGMEDWFHEKVSHLSGGQKQILNLASAMVSGPKVLLLDEPTGQLDPIAAGEFFHTLSRLNRELGTTVILSEHRLEEALPLAKRVLVLEEGTLIADCTPGELGEKLKGYAIYHALPTPMRIHHEVEPDSPAPLTVGEGRQWLEEYAAKGGVNVQRIPPRVEPPLSEIILEAKEIWFRYPQGKDWVLKGFSAEIPKGELYALLGGNGAGKTTAMEIMAGLTKPDRGKILLDGKPLSGKGKALEERISVLPQDPKTLFVTKTVRGELTEVLGGEESSSPKTEERILQMGELCGISELFPRHPYDLSGGEQQRLALAKVLLTEPDILFLDEPTKGMDAGFKREFARILEKLKEKGITLVMVSHDIEFSARYADRCGLLFDGSLSDQDIPARFFAGKAFYTTVAGRMAGKILPGVLLDREVIAACGGKMEEESDFKEKEVEFFQPRKSAEEKEIPKNEEVPERKKPWIRWLVGGVLGLLFLFTLWFSHQRPTDSYGVLYQILSLLELAGCFAAFFPPKREKEEELRCRGQKLSPRTKIGILAVCVAVPLTIFAGMTWLEDRKYYLISVLVLMETLLPFFLLWGRRKNTSRELVLISVLCAIAVAGRMAFSMVPQFKPLLALVILAGICFGGETGFLVGAVTAFVSNFFLGQGPWTPWQMLATGLVGFVAGIMTQVRLLPQKRGIICLYGFLATLLLYGGIMNPISVILYQESPNGSMIVASYLLGLPYDLIHATSTAFFLWVLERPMKEKLLRIKRKYGLEEVDKE